jgi:hypothetical protein
MKIPLEVRRHQKHGMFGPTKIQLVWKTGASQYDYFNNRIKEEDWYALTEEVFWFGDDGIGGICGWSIVKGDYILWNPVDGPKLKTRFKTFDTLIQEITSGYENG